MRWEAVAASIASATGTAFRITECAELGGRCSAGYGARRDLYNLYQVLNHLNLFGGGYRAHAEGMIERLLSEVR